MISLLSPSSIHSSSDFVSSNTVHIHYTYRYTPWVIRRFKFIFRITGKYGLITPSPIDRGTGYCFRSISLYLCIFVCFFVSKITRKRLDRFAWNFQGRCGVTMGWPDYIFGQFRETARCRNAQHGDGVCCALSPQLNGLLSISRSINRLVYRQISWTENSNQE